MRAQEEKRTVRVLVNQNGHNKSLTRGQEVVRTAVCRKHDVKSFDFEGVMATGWLFLCPGPPPDKRKKPEVPERHRFVVDPPWPERV
jgi:hypothetical protein